MLQHNLIAKNNLYKPRGPGRPLTPYFLQMRKPQASRPTATHRDNTPVGSSCRSRGTGQRDFSLNGDACGEHSTNAPCDGVVSLTVDGEQRSPGQPALQRPAQKSHHEGSSLSSGHRVKQQINLQHLTWSPARSRKGRTGNVGSVNQNTPHPGLLEEQE